MKRSEERNSRAEPARLWQGLLGLVLGLSAMAATADTLGSCEVVGLEGARCGTYRVFEDRAAQQGRTIDLNIVVWPAVEQPATADPLFFLTGGPGQGATSMAGGLRNFGGGLRTKRDVVFVDQRGTGESNPLGCPLPSDPARIFGSVLGVGGLASCRDELEKNADLTLYTTSIAMDDLDDVRAFLGYERINLWGLSYGTRAAMTYMRRHPGHVRSAVLMGLSATGHRAPLFYARDAQRAIDRLFSECEADAACSEAFPEVRHEFRVLLDRLRGGPAKATISPIEEADPVEVDFSLGDFGYAVRGMLYGNARAMRLPAMIHRAAAQADFSGFAQLYYRRAVGLNQFISDGMYLSVLCAEDIPFFNDEEATLETEGTFLGRHLIDDYRLACESWRRGAVPRSYHEPIRSSAPTLILSGDRDPVTPPYWAQRAIATLPAARHLVVERAGHGAAFGHPCLLAAVVEFLDEGSADDLELSCMAQLEAPTFVLDLDAETGS